VVLSAAFLAAWMTTAANFDKDRFEGDMRHELDAQVQQRKQAAASRICGINGEPTWLDDTTLECRRHTGRGKPVVTAGVL